MEDKDFIKRLVCCIWFIVLEGVGFCFINVPLELVELVGVRVFQTLNLCFVSHIG